VTAWTQLDLFGDVLSAERQRHRDALTCLRDAVPEALEVVVDLAYRWPKDTRDPRASRPWAYCVCRAGLRFEATDEWWSGAYVRGETWGWNRAPAQLVTWAELSALVGQDPRRAELATWAADLPDPRWRLLTRPFELYPNPGGWHPGYIRGDHEHELWQARRRAWQLVLDLLNDAIDTIADRGGWQPQDGGPR